MQNGKPEPFPIPMGLATCHGQGKPTARKAHGGSGSACGRKQMPVCNGQDRVCNYTYSIRKPTSRRCLVDKT